MSTENEIWDAYNSLLLGPDIERIRKLLVRYDLFRMSMEVPGDIVECGVLKGTSLLFFLKLLQIYMPGSAKRVIGFDMFDHFPLGESQDESNAVTAFLEESSFEGVSPESLYQKIAAAGLSREKCDLVVGDVNVTAAEYVMKNPGLRISLLHLDLDLDSGTYASLDALWPRVVKGGVIIFDEYAVARWTESNAVDRFFSDKEIKLRTLAWSRTPTAYVIKE